MRLKNSSKFKWSHRRKLIEFLSWTFIALLLSACNGPYDPTQISESDARCSPYFGNLKSLHQKRTGKSVYTKQDETYVYTADKTDLLNTCLAIPEDCHWYGFETLRHRKVYYYRSKCMMELALDFRDTSLCSGVVEKTKFLHNGSYYSEESCRQEIARLTEYQKFQQQLRANVDAVEPHQPQSIEIMPSPRGDYLVRITSTGNLAERYSTHIVVAAVEDAPLEPGKPTRHGTVQLEPTLPAIAAGTQVTEFFLSKKVASWVRNEKNQVYIDAWYSGFHHEEKYGNILESKMRKRLTGVYSLNDERQIDASR